MLVMNWIYIYVCVYTQCAGTVTTQWVLWPKSLFAARAQCAHPPTKPIYIYICILYIRRPRLAARGSAPGKKICDSSSAAAAFCELDVYIYNIRRPRQTQGGARKGRRWKKRTTTTTTTATTTTTRTRTIII